MVKDKSQLIKFYGERYDQYGNNVKSVGWGDKESQALRFKILSEIGDLSNSSICDFGCGFGDLYDFLVKKFSNIHYTGIDISPKLIEEAKRQHPDLTFILGDILINPPVRTYDYILASGTLSFKMENHEAYVYDNLKALFEICEKGVAVNFLSSYVDYQLDKNFHFSPEDAFKMGRNLTRFVSVRHDYPLYEFTLYLYKN